MIELDNFQKKAIASIDQNLDVLIVAPTGAGKTLIAEHAIEKAFDQNKKVIYTAPIKSLSNQKYSDFKNKLDVDVGILTGDRSINKDAPLLILTTEILRNMIFTKDKIIQDIGLVVLDEVHFLGDRDRGNVWEEIIIHLPEDINLVYLSATIANTCEFQEWLVSLRGPTDLIVSDSRPIPLISNLISQNKSSGEIINIINIKSDSYIESTKLFTSLNTYYKKHINKLYTRPNLESFIDYLITNNSVPAIYFVFSREKTETHARLCSNYSKRKANLNPLYNYLDSLLGKLSNNEKEILNYDELLWMWSRGISYHHAGMLPIAKEVVELLFLNGYLDILFSTETLSLGINMPAKSVTIHDVHKFDGYTTRPIKGNEYMQLTGRAGRRGIDEIGQSYIFFDKTVESKWYLELFNTKANKLESQYSLSYTSISGLLKLYDKDNAIETLKRSFWAFQNKYNIDTLSKDFNDQYDFLINFSFIDKKGTTKLGENLLHLGRDNFIPSILLMNNESINNMDMMQGLIIISQGLSYTPSEHNLPKEIFEYKLLLEKYNSVCNEYNKLNNIEEVFVSNYSQFMYLYHFLQHNDINLTLNNFDLSPGDFVKAIREAYEIASKLYDIYKEDIFKEISSKFNVNLVTKSIYE